MLKIRGGLSKKIYINTCLAAFAIVTRILKVSNEIPYAYIAISRKIVIHS